MFDGQTVRVPPSVVQHTLPAQPMGHAGFPGHTVVGSMASQSGLPIHAPGQPGQVVSGPGVFPGPAVAPPQQFGLPPPPASFSQLGRCSS